MKLTLTIDQKQFNRAMRDLKEIPAGARRAMTAALNKTITGVRTDTNREVRADYVIKQADVTKQLKARKASRNSLVAELNGTYDPISLEKFKVTPKRTSGIRPAGGLKVSVKKGSSSRIEHAFMANLGGSARVATREGTSRLPIQKRFGPAVVQMLNNPDVDDRIQRLAQERLNKNMEHEIDRLMKGYGK